jgi:septum site-determining protein MinC
MARADKKKRLIAFKGTTLPVISVTLRSLHSGHLAETAANLFGKDGFFDGDAAILELDLLATEAEASPDWTAIRDIFSLYGLRVIGVSGGPDVLRESAAAAGLPGLAAFKHPGRASAKAEPAPLADEEIPAPPAEEIPARPVPPPALIVDRPLRSGQQVYARGGDLVMLAAVNAGAEVIADGSIHIYAPLRGRALSGVSGASDARIFTTRFEAELVSIAGVYRTFENGIPESLAGGPAQVRLHTGGGEEELIVQALKIG